MKQKQLPSITKAWLITSRGFSLVEVILATSIFGLLITALVGSFLYGQEATMLAGNRARAVMLAEEGLEAVYNIQDENFANLVDGTYGLTVAGNQWTLSGASDQVEMFTRQIEIGTIDARTKAVTSTITWQQNPQRSGLIVLVTRFVNWLLNTWLQTAQTDFNNGEINSVVITGDSGGEVSLDQIGDWTQATSFLNINLANAADARDLFIDNNNLYLARSASADPEFYIYSIADVSSSTVSELNSYELGLTPTRVFVADDKAYFSTDSNTGELTILDLDTSIVTNIDVPGDQGATDVYIANNKILISKLDEAAQAEFYVYNLSGTLLGQVEVGDDVNAIAADTNYAYLATADGDELWIVDYNDCPGPSLDCTVTNTYNPADGANSDATAIIKIGNNIYMGRNNNRLHGIDVSNVLSITEFLSDDNGNDQINDIFVDEDLNLAYLATDDTSVQELQIIDISNLVSPTGYDIDLTGAANAYAVIKQGAYLYLASADTNELQILSGGSAVAGSSTIYDDSAQNSWIINSSNATHDESSTATVYNGVNALLSNFDTGSANLRLNNSNFDTSNYLSLNFYINTISPWAYALYADDGNGAGDYNNSTVTNSTYSSFTYNTSDVQDFTQIDINAYASLAQSEGVYINAGGSNYTLDVADLQSYDNQIIYVNFTNSARRLTLNFQNTGGTFTNSIITNGNDIRLDNYIISTILTTASSTVPVLAVSTDDIVFRENDPMTVNGLLYAADEVNSSSLSGSNRVTINGSVIAGKIDNSFERIDIVYSADYHNNPPRYFSPNYFGQDINIRANIGNIVSLTDYLPSGLDNDLNNWELVSIPLSDLGIMASTIDYLEFYPVDSSVDNLIAWWLDSVSLSSVADSSEYSHWGIFTSSQYDSGKATTKWDRIFWSASATTTDDIIKFQLRSAPDAIGVPGTWTDWLGPTSISDFYLDDQGGETINATHKDGLDDQWLQYRAFLSGVGSSTPILEDVSIEYN